jgi:hypothetical protein
MGLRGVRLIIGGFIGTIVARLWVLAVLVTREQQEGTVIAVGKPRPTGDLAAIIDGDRLPQEEGRTGRNEGVEIDNCSVLPQNGDRRGIAIRLVIGETDSGRRESEAAHAG